MGFIWGLGDFRCIYGTLIKGEQVEGGTGGLIRGGDRRVIVKFRFLAGGGEAS